jgi:archaellum component FlaG (FlaF/FlaG flagellin family)
VTAAAEVPVDVIHPAVPVTNDAAPAQVRQGDTVTLSIVVANTGDVPLTDVSVVDSRTPACAQTIGTLPPGASQRHSCTVNAGTDNFVSSATATGTDPTNRQVSATDDASYTVLHPALEIAKAVNGGPFREGDTVPFTVTVTNTGDVPLTAVKITGEPACAKTFDKLEAHEAQKYDCTTKAPKDDVVSAAEATAAAPIGPPVTARSEAKVDVIHPGVAIEKTAKPSTVRVGDDVTFTVVVRNTGDVPLTAVSVVDDETCAKKFDALAPGASQTYTCTRKAPDDDFTDAAEVTGMDSTGRSVQSKTDAKVDVIHPEIAVMKDATPYEVREGDTVTFSVLVKNTGDVPLTAVSVVDDHTPACAHTASKLAVDAEITYACTTIAGKDGFTSRVTVVGQDPTGRPVTASGDATFVVRRG